MPGTSNIPRQRGTICDSGKAVLTAEERRLLIHSAATVDDTLLADGTAVSFIDHHDKKIGNMAADVREVHTEPTPRLAKGSEEKTS